MKTTLYSTLAAAVLAATAVGASPSGTRATALDAASAAMLEALRVAPDSAGTRIYRGTVAPLGAPGAPALFSYERRIAATPEGWSAAHITQDRAGNVIISEQAHVAPDYTLRSFDAINAQLGSSGSVHLSADGQHLEYRVLRGGKLSTASEDVRDPVVSGPSLHGFILRRWDELASGQSIPVRLIVWTKLETYGFHIRLASQKDGRTSFSVTPSHWLIRLAVAPLTVVFDTATRNVQSYEGRVPPMQDVNGKLQALDARVDYTLDVHAYR